MSFECRVRSSDGTIMCTISPEIMKFVNSSSAVPDKRKSAYDWVVELLTGPCCYAIYNPHSGGVKIGKTSNVVSRRAGLMTGNIYELHIIDVWKTDSPSQLESRLHSAFKGHRVRGEWFSADGILPLLQPSSTPIQVQVKKLSTFKSDTLKTEALNRRVVSYVKERGTLSRGLLSQAVTHSGNRKFLDDALRMAFASGDVVETKNGKSTEYMYAGKSIGASNAPDTAS